MIATSPHLLHLRQQNERNEERVLLRTPYFRVNGPIFALEATLQSVRFNNNRQFQNLLLAFVLLHQLFGQLYIRILPMTTITTTQNPKTIHKLQAILSDSLHTVLSIDWSKYTFQGQKNFIFLLIKWLKTCFKAPPQKTKNKQNSFESETSHCEQSKRKLPKGPR